MFMPAADGQGPVTLSAIPSPAFAEGKSQKKEFATADDLLNAIRRALPFVTPQRRTAIGTPLASSMPIELGEYVSEDCLIALGMAIK
jgi:hypothetical protein